MALELMESTVPGWPQCTRSQPRVSKPAVQRLERTRFGLNQRFDRPLLCRRSTT
jgi:hypothetical protein